MSKSIQLTQLLNQWQTGNKQALDDLTPMIYHELRQLANSQLQTNRSNSIHCTLLVNEAYIRLIDVENINYNDRNHFFSIAARIMRRVLVDNFRKNNADKRGNNATKLTFVDEEQEDIKHSIELDYLEEALIKLEKLDQRQADIVTMRFFGGLKSVEIAEILSVSTRTIRREWVMARMWLFKELK